MIVEEVWKDVVGYEGYYKVSNFGRVMRWAITTGGTRGRILKQSDDGRCYLRVNLSKNGKIKIHRVHQLVAEAFLGPIPIGADTNHKDFNKYNNNITNLEYLTERENTNHFMVYKTGIGNEEIELIRAAIASGERQRAIAERYNVDPATISHIKTGSGRFALCQ